MPNRLLREKSLYLRQHADNPVDWHPWGPEAFKAARRDDKPILVSIGYSACHWCHVMAHECFDDGYIAGLMNRHFICIKVDREERPDLDHIYMEAVQLLTQHGGWPLNVFCLPDGRPFFGGTYFPPEDRGQGRVPWPQLLMRIAEHYRRDKEGLVENADNIIKNLERANTPHRCKETPVPLEAEALRSAAASLCQLHDDEAGGFGTAPKFPSCTLLDFLLEVRRTQPQSCDNSLARRIDDVVVTTLDAMAQGGIFDQIGGGFARYSVDREWRVPHFEKMLYDNGQLISLYTKGWLRYRKPLYRAVVEETIEWMLRDVRAPDGGFYASLDADSDGSEGAFYLWTPAHVAAVLSPADADTFCTAYGITDQGTPPLEGSNPILKERDFDHREGLGLLRARLRTAREQRPSPRKDCKRILAWNSLVIRGLAEAGFFFDRRDWFSIALDTAEWLWNSFRTAGDNRLYTVAYDDGPRFNAYLDDYVFYAEALLTLGSKAAWCTPEGASRCQERAIMLTDVVLTDFKDSRKSGFFFTSHNHEKLAVRKKEWLDNALPSGNAALVHVFTALYALTGDQRYVKELRGLRNAYRGLARRIPNGAAYALSGFTAADAGIAVVKVTTGAKLQCLRDELAQHHWHPLFIQKADDSAQPSSYQLCRDDRCVLLTDSPREIVGALCGNCIEGGAPE